MSDSVDQGPDAVEEAIARATLPLAYRGRVRGEDVRVLGYVGQDNPVLEVQVVWYEDPDGNPVPEASHAVGVGSAVELIEAVEQFGTHYELEEVSDDAE